MAKIHTRRNLIIVILMFIVTALMILLARKAVAPPLIGPEPKHLKQARLSKTENGYFILEQALKDIKPVTAAGQISSTDFQRGPKAAILDLYLNEDAPQIAQTIQAARPLTTAVHDALQMPYLLQPLDWEEIRQNPNIYYSNDSYKIRRIFPLLFLVAIEDAKNGDIALAVQAIADYYRFYWRFVDQFGFVYGPGCPLPERVALIRECPPEFHRRLQSVIVDLKLEWRPAQYALDTQLRSLDLQTRWVAGQAYRSINNFGVFFDLTRAKRAMAGKRDALNQAAACTTKQYRQWAAQNPDLAEATSIGYYGFNIEHICHANTNYLMELDAIATVLALEQYKAEIGQYPQTLDTLVPKYLPEVPQDPACEAPLSYRPDGNDYRLYALGSRCQDDGGKRYHSFTRIIYLPPEP